VFLPRESPVAKNDRAFLLYLKKLNHGMVTCISSAWDGLVDDSERNGKAL
jgi:hypothetical protein